MNIKGLKGRFTAAAVAIAATISLGTTFAGTAEAQTRKKPTATQTRKALPARPVKTLTPSDYIWEVGSPGSPLYSVNESATILLASLSKIASMIPLFDQIKAGRLSLDDEITISKEASAATLNERASPLKTLTWRELIRRTFGRSNNDLPVEAGLHISLMPEFAHLYEGTDLVPGTVKAYVDLFVKPVLARLGATSTDQKTITGLPPTRRGTRAEAAYNTSIAPDQAKVWNEILTKYQEFTPLMMETEFFNPKTKAIEGNTNPLIRSAGFGPSKTGYIEDAAQLATSYIIEAPDGKKYELGILVLNQENVGLRTRHTLKVLEIVEGKLAERIFERNARLEDAFAMETESPDSETVDFFYIGNFKEPEPPALAARMVMFDLPPPLATAVPPPAPFKR